MCCLYYIVNRASECEVYYQKIQCVNYHIGEIELLKRSKDATFCFCLHRLCRAELQYLANKTVSTKPDLSTFPLSPEHMKTLNDLKRNKDIIITRPDKGRATVVLDKTDYVDKMMTVLTDETKFQKLGPHIDRNPSRFFSLLVMCPHYNLNLSTSLMC